MASVIFPKTSIALNHDNPLSSVIPANSTASNISVAPSIPKTPAMASPSQRPRIPPPSNGKLSDTKIALRLIKKSMEKNYKPAKWLFAAVTDRILTQQGLKQKFGTQFQKNIKTGRWKLFPINPKTRQTLPSIPASSLW